MKYKIPFIKPSFPTAGEVTDDYAKIVSTNWFTNFGPLEQKFVKQVEKFIGQGVSVTTVANATLGIDLAVRVLLEKDNKKNQVLVPSFTFAAGPEVLITHGFTPVFIDIDETSLQPSLSKAEVYCAKHASTIAGILLCNSFGVGNKQVAAWEKLAKTYKIPLIIDSAAGFGSEYDSGIYLGARGDCEIFSLHATKPFAVGEGGLIVSKQPSLIDKMRKMQNFGFDGAKGITAIGTNAKLQELNCAIGLRQIKGYKSRLKARRASLRRYKQALEPLGFTFQENDELSSIAFVSAIAPNKQLAKAALTTLPTIGIHINSYYKPLHKQKIFKDKAIADNLAVTENISARILSLPLHNKMPTKTIDQVTRQIRKLTENTQHDS